MTIKPTLLAELKRRNVLRAGAFYAAAVWALAQGIAQLGPSVGAPDWVTRWFLAAAGIGFPFWLAVAWFYEFTPQGLKRESETAPDDSIAHSTGRRLDFWIIGLMAVAIVLLLTNQLVLRRDATGQAEVVEAKSIASALSNVPEKSIAVMPLANESGDPTQDYFSDGLSEELISDLTQIDGLKVIGKSSSFQFRGSKRMPAQIGAALGVAHLLEGSVRQDGHRLRIVIGVVKASDGSSIWSHTYDQPLQDVFAIQSQIAQAVADALKIKLLGKPIVNEEKPPSGNIAAYQAMIQGRATSRSSTEQGYRDGIALFEKALSLDPNYAFVWGLLSNTSINLAMDYLHGEAQQQAYARGRVAADRNMALAPDSAGAHLSQAYVLSMLDLDQPSALAEAQRANAIQPGGSANTALMGLLYAKTGQLQKAVAMFRKVLPTDPLRADWYVKLGYLLEGANQLAEAQQAFRQAQVLQPDYPELHAALAYFHILSGDMVAAQREAGKATDPQGRMCAEIAVKLAQGNAPADTALRDYIAKYGTDDAYGVAQLYAIARRPDDMFRWLDLAWERRDIGLSVLLYDPFVLRYRTDPRFAAFCRKIGLPVPAPTGIATPTAGHVP